MVVDLLRPRAILLLERALSGDLDIMVISLDLTLNYSIQETSFGDYFPFLWDPS